MWPQNISPSRHIPSLSHRSKIGIPISVVESINLFTSLFAMVPVPLWPSPLCGGKIATPCRCPPPAREVSNMSYGDGKGWRARPQSVCDDEIACHSFPLRFMWPVWKPEQSQIRLRQAKRPLGKQYNSTKGYKLLCSVKTTLLLALRFLYRTALIGFIFI